MVATNPTDSVSIYIPSQSAKIENSNEQNPKISILIDFFSNTTAHGLPSIIRSKDRYQRAFWFLSFLTYTGIMIYFISKAFIDYYHYPTKIDIDFIEEWQPKFPAFSFCNNNAMRFDTVADALKEYDPSFNNSKLNNTKSWLDRDLYTIMQFFIGLVNKNLSLDKYFLSIRSILYYCRYNSQNCSVSDFINFTSPVFGICYTFNPKLKNVSTDELFSKNQNGGDGKLEIGLYIHRELVVPRSKEGN